jgi:hypothetical protein
MPFLGGFTLCVVGGYPSLLYKDKALMTLEGGVKRIPGALLQNAELN